ncbi:unnamed protein product [Rhizophagus irregularis]|nr:unnamed protein product [Rhizophagus irregularis]
MSNVHTLKDIKNRGHRLGSAYEQKLEKKLRTAINFNSEITDYNEKLQAENSEYSEREKKSQQNYADMENKASQLIASSIKLEDIDLERTYHDLDITGGVIEEPAQISSSDPKEIDSLRLELERAKEDRNSKEYIIECMEKGIESSNNIFKREIDALYSAQSKLREENMSFRDQLQLGRKGILPTFDPTISVGGAEVVPLLATTPIIATSLISPMSENGGIRRKKVTNIPPTEIT